MRAGQVARWRRTRTGYHARDDWSWSRRHHSATARSRCTPGARAASNGSSGCPTARPRRRRASSLTCPSRRTPEHFNADFIAVRGDLEVLWSEGIYGAYIEDLKRRKGADADQPHRIKYKPLVRKYVAVIQRIT